jgi:hypothetical protein
LPETFQLTVGSKALGQRKALTPQFHVPIPPDFLNRDGGEGPTLRDVITHVVQTEVAAFKKRQRDGKLVRILTEGQMEEQAAKGKISMGGRDLRQEVNEEEAVGVALQAFEDGIYLVILDGEEQKDLDRQVHLHEESQLMFVRLVMLAGG